MERIDLTAGELVSALLGMAEECQVCILDGCGTRHSGSGLLIAGIDPIRNLELSSDDPQYVLDTLSEAFSGDLASVFTLSYDFGLKLAGISSRHIPQEPDAFISLFRSLIVHDYDTNATRMAGDPEFSAELIEKRFLPSKPSEIPRVRSEVSRNEYLGSVEAVKERIRCGDTYQTNLTRKIAADLPAGFDPRAAFVELRERHPAPFSAFLKRENSTVISASPERFFKIADGRISASPIKGTRPRGWTPAEDRELRDSLLSSAKDRAENTMIVDLLRNDLGRVCEFGSVTVERLCEIEEHPSLFHLVSTISGKLREETTIAHVLRSLFPCGSITGAPKISTMKLIDELEPSARGLSMGAIGYRMPASFGLGEVVDLSVAIRTMVVQGRTATFNVGGGIVIDSDPASEWFETVTKSRSLLESIGVDPQELS